MDAGNIECGKGKIKKCNRKCTMPQSWQEHPAGMRFSIMVFLMKFEMKERFILTRSWETKYGYAGLIAYTFLHCEYIWSLLVVIWDMPFQRKDLHTAMRIWYITQIIWNTAHNQINMLGTSFCFSTDHHPSLKCGVLFMQYLFDIGSAALSL